MKEATPKMTITQLLQMYVLLQNVKNENYYAMKTGRLVQGSHQRIYIVTRTKLPVGAKNLLEIRRKTTFKVAFCLIQTYSNVQKQACQNEVVLPFIFIDSRGTEEADSTRTRRGDLNSPPLQEYERVPKIWKEGNVPGTAYQ